MLIFPVKSFFSTVITVLTWAYICLLSSTVDAESLDGKNAIFLAVSPVDDSPKLINATNLEEDQGRWSIHGQATYIMQQKNNFYSSYNGQNSLLNATEGNGEKSYTLSATLFLGTKLWQGGELYYNPEMFEGVPFGGQLTGLGGFQNGELQKGAFAPPIYYTARAFFRQIIGLGGEKQHSESGQNQLADSYDKNRIVISYGKFATLDFFDQNTYSHDPRTQFQNFALFSMGAYGYAADTKGFTYGAVFEWYQDEWIVKVARLAVPTIPNTEQLDYSLTSDYTNQIELTHEHNIFGQRGAIRALIYQQHALMGTYQDALNVAQQTNTTPDVFSVRKAGQESWGYGINLEQAINHDVGLFARWSWNPGKTETQTLDISSSLSAGVSIKGTGWKRSEDTLGIGYAVNAISSSQINYLQQGGYTAFIGDGALNYKPEQILEAYYSAHVFKNLFLTADFQYISNPAYNSSRGPISFFGIRAHIEM